MPRSLYPPYIFPERLYKRCQPDGKLLGSDILVGTGRAVGRPAQAWERFSVQTEDRSLVAGLLEQSAMAVTTVNQLTSSKMQAS